VTAFFRFISLTLMLGTLAMAQTTDTTPTAADLARGKKLFEGQCALCHGQTGTGGRGPSLARKMIHAADEASVVRIIQTGIPGTEMAGFWQMSQHEMKQVAAYVMSLGQTATESLPGDPARGRALYAAQGCANCHIVSGAGTALGPELTDVGGRRSAANLREHLTDPGKDPPPGFMMVRVLTRDGRKIAGIRKNEDSFTVQILDAGGRFYSFRKSELADFKKTPGESLMPSFRSLSSAELDDLVAYLAGLRGGQ
jgi:putative heme-binding domain-containing protein